MCGNPDTGDPPPQQDALTLRWDRGTGRRFLGPTLIGRFSRPVSDQCRLVEAFDRHGSPEQLLDPLDQTDNHNLRPSERLRNAVKNLNRNRVSHQLHFFVTDGSHSVGW